MKYTVLQISRGYILMMIRSGNDLICWERRTFTPPTRMLLPSESIEEIVNLCAELIEIARLHDVPVWDIYALMDLSISTVLNIKAVQQRSRTTLDLVIHVLKPDQEALWGWCSKTHELTLRPGPTAVVHLHHNALFCILGDNSHITQIEKLQWSILERSEFHLGNTPKKIPLPQFHALELDIQNKLEALQWKVRPHNLVLSGVAVEIFAQLFQTRPDSILHNQSFTRADIRRWIDTLSQSTLNTRNNLFGTDSDWKIGIIGVCLLLLELCNRSYKDSFTLSEGQIGFGILMCAPTDTNT